MAIVRPFRAVRPHETLADKVAALPYDVMNSEEAREMVKDNPYSFLHVDKSEVDLSPSIDLYDQRVYDKARENIVKFMEEGTLVQEKEKALYIYTLVMDGHPQTGLVSLASIDDYQNNVIKRIHIYKYQGSDLSDWNTHNLEHLTIDDSLSLTDLNGIQNMKNLKLVEINNCENFMRPTLYKNEYPYLRIYIDGVLQTDL